MILDNIKKNIKYFTIFLFASASASLYANTPFDSFYTGIGIGESLTKAKLTSQTLATDTFTGGSTPVATAYNQTLKKDSFFGAIYGGYGFSYAPFYLGGELFLKFSNNNAASYNDNSFEEVAGGAVFSSGALTENTRLTFRKAEVSLDARPGILLSACSLLYGRIGIAFNKTTLNSDLTSTAFNLVGFDFPLTQSLSASRSKNLGFRLGLGLEEMFWNVVGVRVDYTFTRYRRITLSNATTAVVFFPGTGETVTALLADQRRIKPVNHSFMLGLTYYW